MGNKLVRIFEIVTEQAGLKGEAGPRKQDGGIHGSGCGDEGYGRADQ